MAKVYYTEQEAADKLKIAAPELSGLVRDGKLRSYQDGPRKMFKVAEVDALAAPAPTSAGDSGEISLAPADTASGVSLSDADVSRPVGKGDTVITAEGISIFDNEDLEIEAADPMAKTQMTQSLEDQVSIEGVGSGSGLLDLTRESDDTSLGAEVLDHIDMEGAIGSSIGGEAITAGAPYGSETVAIAPPVYVEQVDAASGAFSGMLVAGAAVMILMGIVAINAMMGTVSGLLETLRGNLIATLVAIVVVLGAAAVIGYVTGKSAADKQAALQHGA